MRSRAQDSKTQDSRSQLNSKIESVNYPLGEIFDSYQYLHNSMFFSVLDLMQSFHQISLTECSRKYTAFSVGSYQKFQWKRVHRVPYGMNVGSGLLSAYLDNIFPNEKLKFLLIFVDDLIVFSKTLEEHKTHLKEVFKKLSENNFTVNPDKIKLSLCQYRN